MLVGTTEIFSHLPDWQVIFPHIYDLSCKKYIYSIVAKRASDQKVNFKT